MECEITLAMRSSPPAAAQRPLHLVHVSMHVTKMTDTVVVDLDLSSSRSSQGNGSGPAGASPQEALSHADRICGIECTFSARLLDPDRETGAQTIALLSVAASGRTRSAHAVRIRFNAEEWRLYVIRDMQWAPDWILIEVDSVPER